MSSQIDSFNVLRHLSRFSYCFFLQKTFDVAWFKDNKEVTGSRKSNNGKHKRDTDLQNPTQTK